ncbi:MAG: asparagine synthase (glutamine-hydrolyzing), partial [Candidatus Omnitrophica bacterium]|nr:asparagine synthase (glutamine-hydrolyzing) [Candidatus Omnitrophota bacterium]
HSRLSIIDLNTGHQPMSNENESLWIVFNGEIYNFKELGSALEKEGHVFKTKSDTEVILHLYEKYGEDALKFLRGAFSFALWDKKNKRLFCARDRIGKRPFYYYYNENIFVFGSELKAVTHDPEVKKTIKLQNIDFYLSYGYTPIKESIYEDIKKLPPAHFLILDKDGLRERQYWSLSYGPKIIKRNIDEYEEALLDMLKEATKIRMISDVPIGMFLSGGVDSSLVTALMSQLSSGRIKTFTIGFDYEDYSEIKYARKVAEHLGTDHSEFIVKPEILKILDKLVWHYNEPYGDSSCLPSYYVAKETREHVKVALNGDGGDESFAGYDRYKGARLSEMLDLAPKFMFRFGELALLPIAHLVDGKKKDFFSRRINFMQAMRRFSSFPERYTYWMGYFTEEDKNGLYTDGFKDAVSIKQSSRWLIDKICSSQDINNIVDRMMKVDIDTNLVGDLLVKMDIACMANSLEGRSPLLDHKVMEFAARLPTNLKLRSMTSKFLLKKLASRFIPKEVLYRKKMGFGVPIGQWFKNEMRGYIKEVLLDERSLKRGYFKKEVIQELIDDHQNGVCDNKYKLWALLNLELWHRVFIDD